MGTETKKTEIRLLRADEIECRIGIDKDSYCSLLLYKDARVDMKMLDEVYGSGNWQRTHELIGNQLFCNIDVWDKEKKCWIRKQDVGTESRSEAEKGRASDAFKRAGFNWGIGRELYTAPSIWINQIDKEKLKDTKFKVYEITYNDNREIQTLVIKDKNNKTRFTYCATDAKVIEPKPQPKPQQTAECYTGAEIKIAIEKINGAKNSDELTNVWNGFSSALHKNKEIYDLVKEIGQKFRENDKIK